MCVVKIDNNNMENRTKKEIKELCRIAKNEIYNRAYYQRLNK